MAVTTGPFNVTQATLTVANPTGQSGATPAIAVQVLNNTPYFFQNNFTDDVIPPNYAYTLTAIPTGPSLVLTVQSGAATLSGSSAQTIGVTVSTEWLSADDTPTRSDGPISTAGPTPVPYRLLQMAVVVAGSSWVVNPTSRATGLHILGGSNVTPTAALGNFSQTPYPIQTKVAAGSAAGWFYIPIIGAAEANPNSGAISTAYGVTVSWPSSVLPFCFEDDSFLANALGGGGASLVYAESFIGTSVAITENSPTQITSVTLGPGTWLITGQACWAPSSGFASIDFYLTPNGSSFTGAYGGATESAESTDCEAIVTKIVTLTTTTTVSLSAYSTANTVVFATGTATGAVPKITGITAVQIG